MNSRLCVQPFRYQSLACLACLWSATSSGSRLQARLFTFSNLSRLQVLKLSFKHLNIFVIQDFKISNLSRRSVHPVDDGDWAFTDHETLVYLHHLDSDYVYLSHCTSLTLRSSTGYCVVKLCFGIGDCHSASLVLLTDVPWPVNLHGALSHGAYVPLINVLICDSCQHW
ncbi:hypothetical protein B0H13DRAFT_2074416 [Mycena leptocephala]|nr:hypothetical protein B0H13DRAFT_2074416 [Mycena leptocephala]